MELCFVVVVVDGIEAPGGAQHRARHHVIRDANLIDHRQRRRRQRLDVRDDAGERFDELLAQLDGGVADGEVEVEREVDAYRLSILDSTSRSTVFQ